MSMSIKPIKNSGAITLLGSHKESKEKLQSTIKLSFGDIIEPNTKNIKKTFIYNLSNLGLIELQPEFSPDRFKLISLNLSYNSFVEIPEVLYSLSNLQNLQMDNNLIKSIPSEIACLSSLENFTISNNSIEDVARSIENLNKLTVLLLNSNQLKEWPNVGKDNIKLLNLHSNDKIKGIPFEFVEFKNLKDFSFDWFQYLSEDIKDYYTINPNLKIEEIRRLCKKVLKEKHKENYVTFKDFISYFVHSIDDWQAKSFPIHMAIKDKHNEVILSSLVEFANVNTKNNIGLSPLAISIKEKNKEAANALVTNKFVYVNCIIPNEGTAFN